MFETVEKLIPLEILGPALVALLIWGGVNYLAIGPEVGRRMGALTFHPSCVTSIEAVQRERLAAHEAERQKVLAHIREQKERALEAAREARRKANAIRGVTGTIFPRELRNLFSAVTGQPDIFSHMEKIIELPAVPDLDALELPEVPAPLPNPQPEGRSRYCGCVVNAALDTSRKELALYSGSLRFYTPARISGFNTHMSEIAASNSCGEIPLA